MPAIQFSGIASGIDTASLVDALVEARTLANVRREADIGALQDENTSLDQLNTNFLELSSLIDEFRTINGGGALKSASSTDEDVATATAGSGATNSTVSLNVTSLAAAGTASFDDTFATTSDALAANATGTQTISVLVGQGAEQKTISVDITNSTTVDEFITAFNDNSDAAGNISASAVNVGTSSSPSYKVVFTGLNQGLEQGEISFSIPDAATGFGGNSDLQSRTVSQAANAEFTVSGISGSISRDSNTIGDLLPGVTLELQSLGATQVTVDNDVDSTAEKFQAIVDKYNEIVEFINENDAIERLEEGDDVANILGTLTQTNLDESFLSDFRSALSGTSSSSGTEVTAFVNLGLATDRDGTLQFDIDEFKSQLALDSDGASELLETFANNAAGVNGFISSYTRFDGLIDKAQESNNSEIDRINESISRLEGVGDSLRESLTLQFARLEALTGELQAQQAQLSSLLIGLG